MTVISLEKRLRKVESRSRTNCGPWFFVWTREPEAADEIIASLPDPKPSAAMKVVVRWTNDEDPPAPRWAKDAMLSAIEMEAIIEHAGGGPIDTLPPGTARDPRAAAMSDDELLAAIIEQGFGR